MPAPYYCFSDKVNINGSKSSIQTERFTSSPSEFPCWWWLLHRPVSIQLVLFCVLLWPTCLKTQFRSRYLMWNGGKWHICFLLFISEHNNSSVIIKWSYLILWEMYCLWCIQRLFSVLTLESLQSAFEFVSETRIKSLVHYLSHVLSFSTIGQFFHF